MIFCHISCSCNNAAPLVTITLRSESNYRLLFLLELVVNMSCSKKELLLGLLQ